MPAIRRCISLSFSLSPTLALALAAGSVAAEPLEEVLITDTHDKRTIEVDSTLVISPDTAHLLRRAPGANVNSNGPLSGIPQVRGMYGSRVAVTLDGGRISPAGPDWMDPPLSYAASNQQQSLTLYRGIVPVSVAAESIGGAVAVQSFRGEFSSGEEFELSGRASASAQSVNGGSQLGLALYGSSRQHRVKLAALTEGADDAEFPGGEITPSEYERQRYDLGYGFRAGGHSVQLDYSYTDTDDTGTAALPMDIDYIQGDVFSIDYRFEVDADLTVTAQLFGSELDHGMSNYHLRKAPPTGLWRRNSATAGNLGFKLASTWRDRQGSWVFGMDGFRSQHDSDIDDPQAPAFFVVNFNNAQSDLLGLFIERQHQFNALWRGEFGVRYNHVRTDADEVNGTPALTMPPAQVLRDAFNAADRAQTDRNLDLVAKGWYRLGSGATLYAGVAQKHRTPDYQERYLWLPLQATAGLADGNTYTGNIALVPEVSRQLEFGLDVSGSAWRLAPRVFFSDVKDYIQGTPSEVPPAVMFVQMTDAVAGSGNPRPLQFNNVDAQFYGFDMDWSWQLSAQWSLSGIVNYVRGKRDDIRDDLYRIAPANASARLAFSGEQWSMGLEAVLYAGQDKVSSSNGETESAGYGVLNFSVGWQALAGLRFDVGVDNLLDREYSEHLGGFNRAQNPDVATGTRLPAYGANVYGRVLYDF